MNQIYQENKHKFHILWRKIKYNILSQQVLTMFVETMYDDDIGW